MLLGTFPQCELCSSGPRVRVPLSLLTISSGAVVGQKKEVICLFLPIASPAGLENSFQVDSAATEHFQ